MMIVVVALMGIATTIASMIVSTSCDFRALIALNLAATVDFKN